MSEVVLFDFNCNDPQLATHKGFLDLSSIPNIRANTKFVVVTVGHDGAGTELSSGRVGADLRVRLRRDWYVHTTCACLVDATPIMEPPLAFHVRYGVATFAKEYEVTAVYDNLPIVYVEKGAGEDDDVPDDPFKRTKPKAKVKAKAK